VSRSTLLRWARDGRLPSVTIPSGRRRFRLGDLPGFGDKPDP
jgi:predicted site-specific integrase-resolvase